MKHQEGRGPLLRIACGLAAALALGSLALGCAGGNPHPPGTLERADYFAGKNQRLEAVAAYEAFVRHNPTDSLAAEAQFRKSMLYMDLKEYALAAVEFQILRKDFPTSGRVEEALYQEGLAYRRQVGDIERDASGALEARAHFLRFRSTYPQSTRMPEVEAELQGISDLIVQKRLAQVSVYQRLQKWDAVATVLDRLLVDEPGSSLIDEVLWQRGRTAEKIRDPEAAAEFYSRLANGYPQSRHASAAADLAARLSRTARPAPAAVGS